jgi:hypothetical protein
MSNNAIYNGSPYHIVEVEAHEVDLEPVEGDRDQRLRVDVMASTLIIDPTDDQWAAARRLGGAQVHTEVSGGFAETYLGDLEIDQWRNAPH